MERKVSSSNSSKGSSPPTDLDSHSEVESLTECEKNKKKQAYLGILKRTVLRPQFSLKDQLFLSFGVVSAVVLSAVMITSILGAMSAGRRVKDKSLTELTKSTKANLAVNTRYVSETLTRLLYDSSAVRVLLEATKDRFVGYPNHQGYADDSNVPFFDITSGRNLYPLNESSIPLDWEFKPNVNQTNYNEHVQDRWDWYEKGYIEISTASSVYHMQGQCDPNEINMFSNRHYPNCTEANNDISTGGVIQPTSTNKLIAQKSADLNFMLKALYEFHQNIKLIGVYFANSGAGSMISFPAKRADNSKTYVSIGCEWMSAPNPLDSSRPIASQEEIDRCHPQGTTVSGREYNPLERAWCREQALDPENVKYFGPYRDVFDGSWVVTSGKAVYDRMTKEFIACTLADLRVESMKEILLSIKLEDDITSEIVMVPWDDENGTVMAATGWNGAGVEDIPKITESDHGTGLDQTILNEIKSQVDFGSPWNPAKARIAYESVFTREGHLMSASPIPAIPDSYDENYHPDYIVIMSWDQKRALETVEGTSRNVDKKIISLIQFALIVGFVGLGLILFMIYVVSYQLTRPLHWMNQVGDQIVNKLGQELDNSLDITRAPDIRWSPKTEIIDLVKEFQKMVSNFSGKGIAKVAKKDVMETKNPFSLSSEFEDLYESRKKNGFEYGYDGYGDSPSLSSTDIIIDETIVRKKNSEGVKVSNHYQHFGLNDRTKDDVMNTSPPYDVVNGEWIQVLKSPLFWWISGSIIIPLVVTIILISAVVTWRVSDELPQLVTVVEDVYMDMRANSLALTAKLQAKAATQVMFLPLRDLHIISRVANWLLLGGIKRSSSFTEMASWIEECKDKPFGSCGLLDDPLKAVCDCKWVRSGSSQKCHKYDGIDTRYLQKQGYFIESHDHWPNGDRNYSSFPNVSYSPETTAWWSNFSDVPGSYKGQSASGYDTTYDRLRVTSALSVAQFPIYNYHTTLLERAAKVASFVAFEADGMFITCLGCSHPSSYLSFWSSSNENRAFEIRPELCPKGKYGYDPRCREWYKDGKRAWEENKEHGDQLYVTPPYLFSDGNSVAQSATISLSDNSIPNNKYIGQVLVDFFPHEIVTLLRNKTVLADGGFPILITAKNEVSGGDTVVGPAPDGYGSIIGDSVLLYDCNNSTNDDRECKTNNRQRFEDIVQEMKLGKSGKDTFTRTNERGAEERVNIAYAPVFGMGFRPVNSSDFAKGTTKYQPLIFSLAFAEAHPGLLREFGDTIDILQTPVNVSLGVLIAVMVASIILVLLISSHVTVSMTVPISQLLTIIKHINRSQIKDDLPLIHAGSKEVACVYSTFEKLYTVVRSSSSAYFSGDVVKAYEVLVDASILFRKMKNDKAIGVTNNNLGNTMLMMYQTVRGNESDLIFGMSQKDIIAKGLNYFDSAINKGEEAIERINKETGFSLEYLVFMQQLSNRYFNRAMFLLQVSGHDNSPDDAEALGLSDLNIARDMDVEFIDQSKQEGFEFDEEVRFNLVLGRVRGLLLLKEMSYEFDWDIEDLFEDAFQALRDAMKNPLHNSLFRELGPAGQMQKLDAALVAYLTAEKNDIKEAARVGIRMFIEDEYVFVSTALVALNPLIQYVTSSLFENKDDCAATLEKLAQYKSEFASMELFQCKKRGRIESLGGYLTMETF